MDRRGFLRSAGTTVASGYPLASTNGLPSATEHPQWNSHFARYRFPLLASLGPVITESDRTLTGAHARRHTFSCRVRTNDMLVDDVEIPRATGPTDHPTNLYQARPRHRLRGTR